MGGNQKYFCVSDRCFHLLKEVGAHDIHSSDGNPSDVSLSWSQEFPDTQRPLWRDEVGRLLQESEEDNLSLQVEHLDCCFIYKYIFHIVRTAICKKKMNRHN